MNNQENEARVRASALATELSDEQITLLAAVVGTHDLTDGEVLINQGDRDDRLFVVVSGALEVGQSAPEGGGWVSFARLIPGQIVGELGFLENSERTASVRASGDTVAVSLRRTDLESLLENDPLLIYRVMRAILRSVHQVVSHMNSQHSHLVNYIMG